MNTPITYIADKMGVNYKTMKRILKKDFNDYKGNQAGKGNSKIKSNTPSIQDYLDGKAHITTYRLKLKLIKAGLKNEKCESCGATEWLNQKCPLEIVMHYLKITERVSHKSYRFDSAYQTRIVSSIGRAGDF